MKRSIAVFFTVMFALVCFLCAGCKDKNAPKRKAEFVSGGAESVQPKARPEFLMQRVNAAQDQNRMLPLCGGTPALPVGRPATIGKMNQGKAKENNSSPPIDFKRGRGKVETVKAKGSI